MRRALTILAAGAAALTLALPASAAHASPASKHRVTYKFTVSKVAWTGSRSVIAAADTHGDLYYFWQAARSARWHEQVVAKARRGVSFSKPAIAWTGQNVIIVALDAAGDLVDFVPQAGGTWSHAHPIAGEGGGWQAPSVTGVPGGGALVTARIRTGKLYGWELAPGASDWTGGVISYGISGTASVATCYDGHDDYLGLVTAISDGAVDFWWEPLDNPGWTLETIASPGPGVTFTSASVTATSNSVLVTASTSTGIVDFWSQPIGDSTWSGQTVARKANPSGHPVISSYERLNVNDVITATGPRGQLDFWWQPAGSSTWIAETIAKATRQAAYTSPSITVTGTSVIVTAVNTKPGNVLSWYQRFDTTTWHEQLVAKG
jgi:hypothetical protein